MSVAKCFLRIGGLYGLEFSVVHYKEMFLYSYLHFTRAGIAQWYSAELRAEWTGVRVPAGTGNFSLHHRVQTGSGAHPASYPVGTRCCFPGGKAAGA
jgi:hypothetical protein